jgi:phosphoglycerate dehydrogenase-like enzyme
VGLGDIGSKVARIGNLGFGMDLLVHTENPRAGRITDLGIEARYADLDELLSESDVVTLHAALGPDTAGMLSRQRLELMKPGAYLINTARGTLVDEDALVNLLRAGRIRGAGLDVYSIEPPSPDNPLLQLSNVVLTPHISSNSDDAFARMATMVCESIVDRLRGGEPANCVNPQVYG